MTSKPHKVLNSPAIRRMPSYLHWLLRIRQIERKDTDHGSKGAALTVRVDTETGQPGD